MLDSLHPAPADCEEPMTRLQNINTTDLHAAIQLGCRTMQNIFNADDNFVPFFGSTVWPHAALWFSPDLSECHVPGRHLNALLTAEAVAGIEIDPVAVEHHRRAAFFSFSGPLRLPFNRQRMDGPLVNCYTHNLREGMHALYALVKYRHDAQAYELAEAFIAEVNRLWQPKRGWEVERLRALGINFQDGQGPLNGETRMIGPLVKYFRATGSAAALDLALRLKDDALRLFLPDGAYDHAHFITDHTHSITSSMSSLAQLGDLLNDTALLQQVKAFYDHGLWDMRDEIGWTPGGVFQQGTDLGESSTGGDMVETALILARRGHSEYYADAERILRCHLLPSQLRDVTFMHDAPNPNHEDGLRDAANRHLGAFGVPTPYGHVSVGKDKDSIGFYMDVVGSVVGSLCAVLQAIAHRDAAGQWVHLLFDYDDADVRIESPYTHDDLRITLKRPGPLFVRLPRWLTPSDVVIDDHSFTPHWVNGYLALINPPVGVPIRIRFPLKETTITLSERVHSRPIRLRLSGDSPIAMDNFGADLTFFEPYE